MRQPILIEVNGVTHEFKSKSKALFFALEHINQGISATVPTQDGLGREARRTRANLRNSVEYFTRKNFGKGKI